MDDLCHMVYKKKFSNSICNVQWHVMFTGVHMSEGIQVGGRTWSIKVLGLKDYLGTYEIGA